MQACTRAFCRAAWVESPTCSSLTSSILPWLRCVGTRQPLPRTGSRLTRTAAGSWLMAMAFTGLAVEVATASVQSTAVVKRRRGLATRHLGRRGQCNGAERGRHADADAAHLAVALLLGRSRETPRPQMSLQEPHRFRAHRCHESSTHHHPHRCRRRRMRRAVVPCTTTMGDSGGIPSRGAIPEVRAPPFWGLQEQPLGCITQGLVRGGAQ